MINYTNLKEVEELVKQELFNRYGIRINGNLEYATSTKGGTHQIKGIGKDKHPTCNKYSYVAIDHCKNGKSHIIDLILFENGRGQIDIISSNKINGEQYKNYNKNDKNKIDKVNEIERKKGKPPTEEELKKKYENSKQNYKFLMENNEYLTSHLLTINDLKENEITIFKNFKTNELYLMSPIYDTENKLISFSYSNENGKFIEKNTSNKGYFILPTSGEKHEKYSSFCLITEGVAKAIHLNKAISNGATIMVSYGKNNFKLCYDYAIDKLFKNPIVIVDNDKDNGSINECKKYNLEYINLFDNLGIYCNDTTDFMLNYNKDYNLFFEIFVKKLEKRHEEKLTEIDIKTFQEQCKNNKIQATLMSEINNENYYFFQLVDLQDKKNKPSIFKILKNEINKIKILLRELNDFLEKRAKEPNFVR